MPRIYPIIDVVATLFVYANRRSNQSPGFKNRSKKKYCNAGLICEHIFVYSSNFWAKGVFFALAACNEDYELVLKFC